MAKVSQAPCPKAHLPDDAREAGLSRERVYRSFSAKDDPTFKATLAATKAQGLELTAKGQVLAGLRNQDGGACIDVSRLKFQSLQ